jgi:hypothetical protein
MVDDIVIFSQNKVVHKLRFIYVSNSLSTKFQRRLLLSKTSIVKRKMNNKKFQRFEVFDMLLNGGNIAIPTTSPKE